MNRLAAVGALPVAVANLLSDLLGKPKLTLPLAYRVELSLPTTQAADGSVESTWFPVSSWTSFAQCCATVGALALQYRPDPYALTTLGAPPYPSEWGPVARLHGADDSTLMSMLVSNLAQWCALSPSQRRVGDDPHIAPPPSFPKLLPALFQVPTPLRYSSSALTPVYNYIVWVMNYSNTWTLLVHLPPLSAQKFCDYLGTLGGVKLADGTEISNKTLLYVEKRDANRTLLADYYGELIPVRMQAGCSG